MGIKLPDYIKEFIGTVPPISLYPERQRVPQKVCECCGRTDGVESEPSRTAYHWDRKGEDPNRDVLLCRVCAVDHHAHWDDMWANYYGGLL
jgi:hypothetical protein